MEEWSWSDREYRPATRYDRRVSGPVRFLGQVEWADVMVREDPQRDLSHRGLSGAGGVPRSYMLQPSQEVANSHRSQFGQDSKDARCASEGRHESTCLSVHEG